MNTKGRVTIPTDMDAVPETLDLLKRWGADAIRDCDGTEFPQELKDTGAKIYATYYTTRKDNAWAKANPDETQQCYIMTPFYTAADGALTIPLMTGISRELMKVNDHDDIARWWEVIDRTTGEPLDAAAWHYDAATESVVIDAPAAYHDYTVSFLAYLIWDPVHMYNSVINDWKDVEHQIPFDVRQPKTHAYTMRRLREYDLPHDMVSRVSCRKRWFSRTANHRFDVVAVDCGIKHNIIRKLNEKGCNVTVVPYDITAEEVMAFRPDGLFLSNGPGDPTDVQPVIEMVRTLRGRLPIFGICLGHQVISLAYGARTFKMKFGHRGGNHPVKNLETGKVEITSQNHSFAVDTESLKGTGLTLTHLNLLDDTAEGVECRADRIFSVQYHPESAPGPQDSTYLFDKFIKMMEESQNA